MRITQIILSKQLGGAERHAAGLSNELAGSHDVQVILRRPPHRQAAVGHSGNIASLLDPRIAVCEVGSLFRNRRISRLINAFRPNIVHTHLGDAGKAVRAIRPNAPVVGTLHGEYKDKCYRAHEALICVAEWQRQTIPPQFRGRIETIPNFISRLPQPSAPAVEALRRELGMSHGGFVAGAVGRLAPEKGLDTLLDAFREAAIPESTLVLVGDGPERAALELQAPPNVIFAGWRNDPWPFYGLFDIFVLPSRYEAFGISLLEALHAGVPVLSTRSQGPGELLADGGGMLVDVDDVPGMAQALRHLASSPESRLRLAADGRRTAEAHDISAVVPRIEALYRDLIG